MEGKELCKGVGGYGHCSTAMISGFRIAFREAYGGGLKDEDRNWSRTAMPDSYWPSSKQLLTRLR